MIAIIDYGMGNLQSVQKAFLKLGFSAEIISDANKLNNVSHIVLPGVGAFKDAMYGLNQTGFIEPLMQSIQTGKPLLGICLGLQLLFTESSEGGRYQGLNLIPGRVDRFPDSVKVPQIGWNQIKQTKPNNPLLQGVPDNAYVYFVHSYYVIPEDNTVIATTTEYGIAFTSMIWKDNIFATQFHPEKSQKIGLQILANFATLK
ncbi:MAG: imidazole glycerol phosphate synthase subunit HisH [bacterium]|nr:imidazole glycerol phosphate synthase subunit HisH [bacterium]